MSEFQYVAFRAVDAPLSGEDLEFMERQSTRAEVTPWSFDNEYHYGDFRGNAAEMLRRGYDFHLHYANFGIRQLMIRLPSGLPAAAAAKPYFGKDALRLLNDKQGPGQILCVEPYHEPGDLDDIWDADTLIDPLLPLRAEILDGDLRPLYLAHLAVACDSNHDPDKTTEGPVPAGLNQLTAAQHALAELYDLGGAMVAAAAQKSSPLPARIDANSGYATWLQQQPEVAKDAWLAQLMANPRSAIRTEVLTKFRNDQHVAPWPVSPGGRTITELRAVAEDIQREQDSKNAERAALERKKKLADMAADPQRILRETEQLAKLRSTAGYRQIASLLADLRDSLAGTGQSDLPEKHARKLKQTHPTLARLTAELRRQGFLKK